MENIITFKLIHAIFIAHSIQAFCGVAGNFTKLENLHTILAYIASTSTSCQVCRWFINNIL